MPAKIVFSAAEAPPHAGIYSTNDPSRPHDHDPLDAHDFGMLILQAMTLVATLTLIIMEKKTSETS